MSALSGEPDPTFLGLIEIESDTTVSKSVLIPRTIDKIAFRAVSLRFVLETPPATGTVAATKVGIIRDQDKVGSNGQRPVADSFDIQASATMRTEFFVTLIGKAAT